MLAAGLLGNYVRVCPAQCAGLPLLGGTTAPWMQRKLHACAPEALVRRSGREHQARRGADRLVPGAEGSCLVAPSLPRPSSGYLQRLTQRPAA